MRKNTFIKGAFITTLGIVITKIMGILYVIPFHAIVGDEGGALYGYAYTIYLFFLSLSSAGIPLAISKVVSEYQTLGFLKAKQRAFYLGKRIAMVLGLLCFIIVTVFAPFLAKSILGDIVGGNSIDDVIFVIRVVATALIVVPILSVYRGYFEGHRIMSPPSVSQVLEQLLRIFIIIFGSLFTLKAINARLSLVVGVAIFGATIGCLIAYIYLNIKYRLNKKLFLEKIRNVNEPIVTDRDIIKKICLYAFPFIMIDVFKALYNYVDMVTIVKGLVNYANYTIKDAEVIYSIISTWAQKFNMILSAISTGIIVSLIPNLTELIINNKKEKINRKINISISILSFFIVPMSLGICLLSRPIWNLFYGYSLYGPNILSYNIFVGLIISLFTTIISVLLTLKDYKGVFVSLLTGLIFKIIFNFMLCRPFISIGFPTYYGYLSASILGYLIAFIVCIVILINNYNISFEDSIKNFFDILCGSVFMIFSLLIVSFIVPLFSTSRLLCLLIIIIYALIGVVLYYIYGMKSGLIKRIFGDRSLFKWLCQFIKKSK